MAIKIKEKTGKIIFILSFVLVVFLVLYFYDWKLLLILWLFNIVENLRKDLEK